jgi:hypothetical protein
MKIHNFYCKFCGNFGFYKEFEDYGKSETIECWSCGYISLVTDKGDFEIASKQDQFDVKSYETI